MDPIELLAVVLLGILKYLVPMALLAYVVAIIVRRQIRKELIAQGVLQPEDQRTPKGDEDDA